MEYIQVYDDRIEITGEVNACVTQSYKESYIWCTFHYGEKELNAPIPIRMPRRDPGLNYYKEEYSKEDKEALLAYIRNFYPVFGEENVEKWKAEQKVKANGKSNATMKTLGIFLNAEDMSVCTKCSLTSLSTNAQKNIEKLRSAGYVIFTGHQECNVCGGGGSNSFYRLLPFMNNSRAKAEVVDDKTSQRIFSYLGKKDAITGREYANYKELLADHKFPEDRWGNMETVNNSNIPNEDIPKKFQLLTQSENFEKRAACSKCIQTGKRPKLYGIDFYYEGDENWDENIETTGAGAERGCVGCGWYDVVKWKEELNKRLADKN